MAIFSFKMKVVLFVSLLPVISCSGDQAKKLIGELNHHFNFDHDIFLKESTADIVHYMDINSETPQTIYVQVAQEDNTTSITKISSKNTFLIVILESSTIKQSYDFLEYVKTIQQIQISMKIGVFFRQAASIDDVRTLFEWCKKHLVVNVFAASSWIDEGTEATEVEIGDHEINIFTFTPFGMDDMINVSNSSTYDNLFPSLKSNFQQYPLRLSEPFDGDIVASELWSTVFRLMNASFEIDKNWNHWMNNPYNVDEHFQHGIDVILNWSEQKNQRDLQIYPIIVTSFTIIVPEAKPYSDFSAYLRNALSNEVFGYSFAAITAVMFVLIVCRYITHQEILFFTSVVDVLNILMNDNSYIKYQKLSRSENLIIGPLTFVGFIIVNGIFSNLQSIDQPGQPTANKNS